MVKPRFLEGIFDPSHWQKPNFSGGAGVPPAIFRSAPLPYENRRPLLHRDKQDAGATGTAS